MTSHFVVHPSMLILASLGDSSLTLLCSFTFFHTSYSSVASSLFFSFICGYSHFLCLSFPHLKHCGFFSITSCLLSSFTLHCITQFFNISNLFPSSIFFFYFPFFLQFWAKCLNCLQLLYILSSLFSNTALNLARACLLLSILLMSLLYCFRDMMLCSEQVR